MAAAVIKAIYPEELMSRMVEFSNIVIEAFNELLLQNFILGKRHAVIYRKELLDKVVPKGVPKKTAIQNEFFNVKEVFRDRGWVIEYIDGDRPKFICAPIQE